ncbi:hypothetical protein FQN54_006018 [Arachnomyces sp. PD_36]|nr:hypothetical protein FQN54_006018 [Arachnomyces sp. PD_36]
MDALKSAIGGGSKDTSESSSSSSGGFMDKLNSAAGGGKESEKKEDYVDKGVDYVQENFLGQGKQDNESAFEQAKDDKIADFVRGQYKTRTGSDMPGAEKS